MADLNVIDFDNLNLRAPEMVQDLPVSKPLSWFCPLQWPSSRSFFV